ncbi:2-hydroxychromene-2-carboxylate isomerase [Stappia sp.]|uniref:2-hydroxychromene-2-carboxylate isomerase n=1 Tax=Stappia sp. TaxID=1870903 RepID=UPI0025D56791|nr:2-hydroxychromene-2-carboxylate isomerase [Stappia sp.]
MPQGNENGNAEEHAGGAIEFWFDFGSSYAYFAAMEIDALAERCDRPVLWRPFLLGTAFRQTGAQGLSSTPLKKDYAARDWARLARARGIAFSPPPGHPAIALAATRAYYTLEDADPDQARAFAREVFRRVYQSGDLDTSDADQVARLGAGFGIDQKRLRAALDEPALKARVKAISEDAVARGIFGSPFFIVDGEPFWGADRMAMMEAWIETGGW